MKEKAATKNLVLASDTDVISVNERKRLKDIEKQFPNLQVIIGEKNDDDKPVPLDLAEMENTRQKIFDAATDTVLGNRIDTLQRPRRFPLPMVSGLIGFLLGVAATFLVYNL